MFCRRGFTLIELVVAVAIMAILLAILIPAVQSAREAMRRTSCQSNIRQLALALHSYEASYRRFPPGYVSNTRARGTDWCTGGRTNNGAPWTVLVLPFLEETALHGMFRYGEDFTPDQNNPGSLANHTGWLKPVPKFRCPSAIVYSENNTNYVGVQGGGLVPDCMGGSANRVFFANGILFHNSTVRISHISDGSSNTFLVGETKYQARRMSWASTAKLDVLGVPMTLAAAHSPINDVSPPLSPDFEIISRMFGSYHPGGCHFALADGAVRFVSESIDGELYRQLADRSDGHPLEGPP